MVEGSSYIIIIICGIFMLFRPYRGWASLGDAEVGLGVVRLTILGNGLFMEVEHGLLDTSFCFFCKQGGFPLYNMFLEF